MEEKIRKFKKTLIFSIFLLTILVIVEFLLILSYQSTISQLQQEKTKPMVFTKLLKFTNYEIGFVVLNFGDQEAKNVSVFCYLSTLPITNKNYITEHFKVNVGNIASHSTVLQTITSYYTEETNYVFCFTYSCDNCIILEKLIDEFKEDYKLAEELLK
ncbi:MAG: hypothetical protein NZ942_03650 [Candidatus Aenigmarchaeota archaeon]|nr:hypothetical protein [Candidatus Aenigmarchaeota archaeon]